MASKKELDDWYRFHTKFMRRVHEALKPSIRMWQKQNNKPLTWPDTVKHIKWLVKQAQAKGDR